MDGFNISRCRGETVFLRRVVMTRSCTGVSGSRNDSNSKEEEEEEEKNSKYWLWETTAHHAQR